MGFQVSPGVNISELDLTTIVPAISSTAAGIAGIFQWGPCHTRVLVDSENTLRQVFGKPTNVTANYFFSAANFLGYGNNLQVVRVVGSGASGAFNASPSGTAGVILNEDAYESDLWTSSFASSDHFIAKYPGVLGNSLAVYVLDGEAKVTGSLTGGSYTASATGITLAGVTLVAQSGDIVRFNDGTTYVAVSGATGAGGVSGIQLSTPLGKSYSSGITVDVLSRINQNFSTIPSTTQTVEDAGGSNDEIHIAVVDKDGLWTGIKGQVIEAFEGLSKFPQSIRTNGENIYYKNVINRKSKYIWAGSNHITDQADFNVAEQTWTTVSGAVGGYTGLQYLGFTGGSDGDLALNEGKLWEEGYSQFEDAETVDVSLLIGGTVNSTVQQLIIDLCDKRKDCIAFVSPVNASGAPEDIVVNKTLGDATTAVVNYRNNVLNKSSSYAVLDSGYKWQYDRYNDVYRYIPLNADIAGLCARSEQEFEAWYSPAGFNRGQIRGVVKLPFNPKQTHRDNLYKAQVNPVVAFPGEGTILFGDKTLQSKPSAFDRINVRRLFIILEKAIATAAKFQLFEFNDDFTRSQFVNLVTPFLRDVQSRRGLIDFKVVCDESNNPGSVIDRNEFVADIYIKPTRSINFIQLNFIATATGVDFTEVGG